MMSNIKEDQTIQKDFATGLQKGTLIVQKNLVGSLKITCSANINLVSVEVCNNCQRYFVWLSLLPETGHFLQDSLQVVS